MLVTQADLAETVAVHSYLTPNGVLYHYALRVVGRVLLRVVVSEMAPERN